MKFPESESVHVTEQSTDEAAVYHVTVDRPAKLNTLTPEMATDLVTLFDSIESDEMDCLVLTGTGEDFCAGADVSTLDPSSDERFDVGLMQDLVEALRGCPVPIVARAVGRAYGAGFMLCMGADLVVATDDAEFALQEVRLGLPVEGYTTTILERIVGERYAREWILTGSTISASRAAEAGFVTRAVAADELDDVIADYVSTFGANSNATIATLKARMADPTRTSDAATVRDDEREALERAYQSDEVRRRIEELLAS